MTSRAVNQEGGSAVSGKKKPLNICDPSTFTFLHPCFAGNPPGASEYLRTGVG